MRVLEIAYDLRQSTRDYAPLHARLRALGARRVLQSTWLVATSADRLAIFHELAPFVDRDDALLVTDVTHGAAWSDGRLLISDAEMQALWSAASRSAA